MDSDSDNSGGACWGGPNHYRQIHEQGHSFYGDCKDGLPVCVQLSGTHIALYNTKGEEVAKRHFQPLEVGDLLEGLVLSPSKKAIFIEHVLEPFEEVYEILLYTIGDCLNKVIRWPANLVRPL